MENLYRHKPTEWENWSDFYDEIRERGKKPARHPTFVFYFAFVLIVGGGVGVWLPFFANCDCPQMEYGQPVEPSILLTTSRNMATYILAMVAASFADIMLSEVSRALRMVTYSLGILGAACGTLIFFIQWVPGACILALFGVFFGLALWWLANADETKLHEKTVPPNEAVGRAPETVNFGTVPEDYDTQ